MSNRPPRRDPAHRGHPLAALAVQASAPVLQAAESRHAALLYQSEADLVRAMANWAEAGLRAGESVALLVRPTLGAQVRARLAAAGTDLAPFEALGRCRLLDADRTLARLMVGGRPQPGLFANATEPLLEALRKASPAGEVRAWGEMADLLWRRAQGPAATALEALWDGLLATHPLRLLCSHQADAFDALQFPKIRALAAGHHLLVPTADAARMARAVDAALADTYGPEADAVRALLGPAPPTLPLPLHRLLALHDLAPAFGALVAARAALHHAEDA